MKAPRRLIWFNEIGTIELQVELDGETISVNASPIHASILMHFADKSNET